MAQSPERAPREPSLNPASIAAVLVTGPPPGCLELARLLEADGVRAERFAAIEILPPEDPGPLAAAALRSALGGFDWVVLTSVRGVRALARALEFVERSPEWKHGRGREGPVAGEPGPRPRARIAAVGSATAHAARAEGWSVDLVPETFSGEGLEQAFGVDGWQGLEVLLPVADRASDTVPAALRARGAQVEVVTAYRTVKRVGPELERVKSLIQHEELDVVTFTSPSAVEGLLEVVGNEALALPAAVIGPVTGEAAARLGFRVVAIAEPHTTPALARVVLDWLETSGRKR